MHVLHYSISVVQCCIGHYGKKDQQWHCTMMMMMMMMIYHQCNSSQQQHNNLAKFETTISRGDFGNECKFIYSLLSFSFSLSSFPKTIQLYPSPHPPRHRRPPLLCCQNCWGYNEERRDFSSHSTKHGVLPPCWVFSDLPLHACISPIQAVFAAELVSFAFYLVLNHFCARN